MTSLLRKHFSLILSLLLIPSLVFGAKDLEKFRFDGNTVTTINANGGMNFSPNGTGKVKFNYLSNGKVLVTDGSGNLITSSLDASNLVYFDISSSLTTLLAGKQDAGTYVSPGGAATFTDKTIDGDDNTLLDIALSSLKTVLGDANKFLIRNGSGAVVSSKTVPAGEVVGTTDTQTLSGKTLTTPIMDVASLTEQAATPATPSAGTKKFYAKNDGKLYTLNATGTEIEVGSGASGGSGLNYITNGTADTDTNGWTNNRALAHVDGSDVAHGLDFFTLRPGQVAGILKVNDPITAVTITSMPPLVQGTVYYVKTNDVSVIGGFTYQDISISSTPGGATIDLQPSSNGNRFATIYPNDTVANTSAFTFTRTTISPLRGQGSFLISKPASNAQGSSLNYSFTTDPAMSGREVRFTMDYAVTSGTFIAGSATTPSDLQWFIYDVTNSKLIGSTFFMDYIGSNPAGQLNGVFTVPTDSTSFRLVGVQSLAGTSAYALKFDNVSISPRTSTNISPVTSSQSWVPTFTGLGTPTIQRAEWYQSGDQLFFDIRVTAGTVTSSPITFTLPSGLNVPFSESQVVGQGITSQSTDPSIKVIWDGVTATNLLSVAKSLPGTTGFAVLSGATIGNSNTISMKGSVKIAGWSSSVRMSDGYDNRPVAMFATKSSIQSIPNNTITTVVYDSVTTDTVGGMNGSTGIYTVKTSGYYDVEASLYWDASTVNFRQIFIRKNSVTTISGATFGPPPAGGFQQDVSATAVYFNAGETISIQAVQDRGSALNAGINGAFSQFRIRRSETPQVIGQSEPMLAVYKTSSGQSIPNNSATIINYNTKVDDTHGSVTTGASWKWTAQRQAKCSVKMGAYLSGTTSTATDVQCNLFKNNTIYLATNTPKSGTGSTGATCNGSFDVIVNPNDTLDGRVYQNSGGALTLVTAGEFNFFSVSCQ